jgi:hypothetical protein
MSEPKFIQRAVNSGGIATTQNTVAAGTGALTTIATCDSPAGLRIDAINFVAMGTTTASLLRVYLVREDEDEDGNVVNADVRLIKEIPVAAVTAAASAKAWSFDWAPLPPLLLAEGHSLKFARTNTGTINIHASIVSGGIL